LAAAPNIALPAFQPPRGVSAPQQVSPRPQQQQPLPELRQDYDSQYKIRQVELSLIDFKGAIERRFTEIQSDLPQRLSREIKAFESREQQLAKDIAEKLA
jgi:hypothetical protein